MVLLTHSALILERSSSPVNSMLMKVHYIIKCNIRILVKVRVSRGGSNPAFQA